MAPRLAACALLLASPAFLACGGQEPDPPPPTPQSIAVLAGDNQQAQAGTLLPVQVQFVVRSSSGPLAGIQVQFSLSDQTGFLSATNRTSDAEGKVSVGWSVGGALGLQTLTAALAGGLSAEAHATVSAGPPALIIPATSANQFTVVSRTVPIAPTAKVADAYGNPIAGVTVDFVDQTGRSTVVGATAVTNAAGLAGITSWTIGASAGAYSLVATAAAAGGLATSFVAFGIPATMQILEGDGQSANAGTRVAVEPAVVALDDASQPVPGVRLTFSVSGGEGRLLTNGSVLTADDGIGRTSGWILGLAPGANTLTISTPGMPDLSVTASGVAAQPAQFAATSSTTIAGLVGNFVAPSPTVRVLDAGGQPVAGVPVSFTPGASSGVVTHAAPLTDFNGEATLGAWRLDPDNPAPTLTAAIDGLPPVTFAATAAPIPPGDFEITVRFTSPEPTESQKAAFTNAAARWAQAIRADLVDIPFALEEGRTCGTSTIAEDVDDVLIFATIEEIDGPGQILGSAGPCYVRDDDLLTVVGRMRFDVSDVQSLQASGRFESVILHEMGHVLGIGSLWPLMNLIVDRGGADPIFVGAAAQVAFAAADPTRFFGGRVVPVENTGGLGTRDGHWREQVLTVELMTGFSNTVNPLSAVTIASLRDQGYVVNDAVADDFSIEAALRAVTSEPLSLNEAAWVSPIRSIDRRGQLRRVFLPLAAPYRP
ncbi:MAG: leishmanolysin-related zinc metalloendopeptidase [Gemmatimonadales bacterium]